MLDAVTLDQLRTLIAAADCGSFTAAGRQLGRAQSVVSQTLANLENQIGIQLFDRTTRKPQLTLAGQELLEDARHVVANMDRFKAKANRMAAGLEPELNIVIHTFMPTAIITKAIRAFQAHFPYIPLHLSIEGMGAVMESVQEGTCSFGIRVPLFTEHPKLANEYLMTIPYLMLASPMHPLARLNKPLTKDELRQHVQLVLSDHSRRNQTMDMGILSPKVWRLSDLSAKHTFLKDGLGWGGMPRHVVQEDLEQGRLVALTFEGGNSEINMPLSATYRTDMPPGPAGRWLLEELKKAASNDAA